MSLKKYDRQFKDPANLSQVLFCPICQEIFKRPVIISCGHTFCKHCIATSHIKSKSCPTCRQRLSPSEKLIRNVFAEQIIDEQIVVCEQALCNWEGPLNSLQNHKKHCEYCPKVIDNPLDEEQNNPIIITDDGQSSEEDSSSSIEILQEKSKKTIPKSKKRKNGKEMKHAPQKKIHCLEEEEDEEEEEEIGVVVPEGKDKKHQVEKMFIDDEEEGEENGRCFREIYLQNNRLFDYNRNNQNHYEDFEKQFKQSQGIPPKWPQSPDQDSLEIFSDKDDYNKTKDKLIINNNVNNEKIDQSSNPFYISQHLPMQVQERPALCMRRMYPYGFEELDEEHDQFNNYFQMKSNLESRKEKEIVLEGGGDHKEDKIEINQENEPGLKDRDDQQQDECLNRMNDQDNQNNQHDANTRKLEQRIQEGDKLTQETELTIKSQKEIIQSEEQEKEKRKRQEEWDRDCQMNPLLPLIFRFEA